MRMSEAVTRVAAIDVGTNTVMCLVADVMDNGTLRVLADEERFARLGEGVDRTGRLSEAPMDRVVSRLREALQTIRPFDVDHVVLGATSASRDASNIQKLIDYVRNDLGLEYRILSGEEEALLTCRGALSVVSQLDRACVLDIGGGSTEVAVWDGSDIPFHASADIGSVRLTESYFLSEPPGKAQLAIAKGVVEKAIASLNVPVRPGLKLVEGGGTARVLASFLERKGQAPVITRKEVSNWLAKLQEMSPSAILALNPAILAGREDVCTAALLILDVAMEQLGFDTFVASSGGLRHGLALALADDV